MSQRTPFHQIMSRRDMLRLTGVGAAGAALAACAAPAAAPAAGGDSAPQATISAAPNDTAGTLRIIPASISGNRRLPIAGTHQGRPVKADNV